MGTVLHLNRTGPHSHLSRTKVEAEGTAARCRRRRARFGGFDTQEGILGLVGGKWDHHNLRFDSQTWQIKYYLNRHPNKIKSAFSNI
jgi:hypothetical protein